MPTKERTSPEQDFNTFRPMFDRLLAGKTATEVIQIEADGEEIKQKQRIQHAKRVLRAWHWVLSQGLDGFPSEEGKPGFEDYFRQRSAIAFTITPETGDLILYLRDGATEPLHSAIGSGINFLKQGLSVAQAAEKSGADNESLRQYFIHKKHGTIKDGRASMDEASVEEMLVAVHFDALQRALLPVRREFHL